MIKYVVKNKEGYYYNKTTNEFDITKLNANCILNTKQYAESILHPFFVIPITICEGDLEEENRVLKKAFRNLIEEYLTAMNYINGDSLKVTKKEIDEDFDERIQQAKE